MFRILRVLIPALCLMTTNSDWLLSADDPLPRLWAELCVVDQQTGRGVPLVELETVNGLRFVTDNAGRVAFFEPGLMGREVHFTIRAPGYSASKDGFGIAGVKVTPRSGEQVEIKVSREILAERLCRLTGEGLYRDSLLLGYSPPLACSPSLGRVAGQDSIQAAVYRDQIFCFWGDTSRMSYPLGLFRTAGATLPVSASKGDPSPGLPYEYFVDNTGFARAMIPLKERPEGVIWIDGVATVPDASGAEVLFAHFSRRRGLMEELEHGIARFDDQLQEFVVVQVLPLDEKWRHPSGHPVHYQADGQSWLLFGSPQPNVRVPARWEAVLESDQYEAFTCRSDKPNGPVTNSQGEPDWRWQRVLAPVDSKQEEQWVKAGKLSSDATRFLPVNVADKTERVQLHNGTVRWSPYRNRWVLLAGQLYGKPSMLGEVWYAESEEPTGPFRRAVRVVSHDRQTFYNVCHHTFLDRDGGRTIHFEGTYTNDFSGNPEKTPRYNYNQVLYRLDLELAARQLNRE